MFQDPQNRNRDDNQRVTVAGISSLIGLVSLSLGVKAEAEFNVSESMLVIDFEEGGKYDPIFNLNFVWEDELSVFCWQGDLKDDGTLIVGHEQLLSFITNYITAMIFIRGLQ